MKYNEESSNVAKTDLYLTVFLKKCINNFIVNNLKNYFIIKF